MEKLRICVALFFACFSLAQAGAQEPVAEEALRWEDCLAEAQKNNPDLISSQESVHQQKAGKDITASGLYPQISASVDAATAKATSGATTDTYSLGVSGTQLVFDGFKTVNDVNAAAEDVKASRENYRFTSSAVRLSLRTAFVNLLKAQELVRVAQEIVKIRRDNLVLITLRYTSGLEHKGALLTAEANLASANFELSQAQRSVASAQRQLIAEMGRKEFKPVRVEGDFEVRDAAEKKPLFEELSKNNPSLLEAEAKKNSAAFGVKSAYADFLPEFSGRADAGRTSSSWPPRGDQWNVGLGMSVPIFEGGLQFAQVSQAKAAYRQAEADEDSARNTVVTGLEQAWASLQDAIETVGVQGKVLEATQERSKIAQAQYSTGFIAFDNWIIIEDDLVRAKKAYLEAQANALLAEARWVQAKGETLEYAQ